MSLHSIVAALGGELYAGGTRASVPAPGHSAQDRSVSLLLSEGRVLVHCFGGADWREVRDHLRGLGLIDADGRPRADCAAGGGGAAAPGHDGARPQPPSGAARREVAVRLWSDSRPVSAVGPAAAYLRRRQVAQAASSPGLRGHPAVPLSVYRPGAARAPALLAALTAADGTMTAVEITYLDFAGRRRTRLRTPRKLVGTAPPGAAVRLAPAGPELLVAEGVFTALSAGLRFGAPAWALLSASCAASWTPPPGVRQVIIAADRDRAGWGVAARLADRLSQRGVAWAVAFPPAPHNDWNDWAVAAAAV